MEVSEATRLAQEAGAEARIMWADASANWERLSNEEGVRRLFERCRSANINIVVVDVKDINGSVLYDSRIAPRLTEHKGVAIEPGFDLLKTAAEEGRRHGISVYASINVFSEGRRAEGGPVFDHPEWESVVYLAEPWVGVPGEIGYPVAGVNQQPLPGRLALYTDLDKVPADAPGLVKVNVHQDGQVLDAQAGAAYVLAGSGAAGAWLERLVPGTPLQITSRPKLVPARHAGEMHNAIFVNPANQQAREYELSIIQEIASNYDIDGIILDRMRYSGLNADFSNLSREKFETWLGSRVENWPQDIITFSPLPDGQAQWGPLFQKWLEWRAHNIKSFFEAARGVIKSVDSDKETAVYVGSWYWSYYPMGVNWASDKFHPRAAWASPEYHRTGYATTADWITTGCYYPTVSRQEARENNTSEAATVQAAAEVSTHVIDAASFTYGGLYLIDYRNNSEAFRRAIQMCRDVTQGVMLFDLVYVENYDWWGILEEEFPQPALVPHQIPALRQALREVYERR